MMQGWLLWFALTAAFCLMGVGMASWQSGMDFGGEMGTAHIEVAFTNHLGSTITSSQPEDWSPSASAIINRRTGNDQELEITINNAYPGLEVEFWYEIENTGSLPVIITRHEVISSFDQVGVGYSLDASSIGVSGSTYGSLIVNINSDPNVEPLSLYTFSVEFEFEPDI